MKSILFSAALFAAGALCAQTHRLAIEVDGIETVKGNILVAVYDSANFLKRPDYWGYVKVERGEATVVIDSVRTGVYAVALFHDENGNNRLDTGAYGIPSEPTGFSNNAKSQTDAPTFADCRFEVRDNAVIYITLHRYRKPDI